MNIPPFTTKRRIKEFTEPASRCNKCGKYYCLQCGHGGANNICNRCFQVLTPTQKITKIKDDKDNLICLLFFAAICTLAFTIYIIVRGIFEIGFIGFFFVIIAILIFVGLIFLIIGISKNS